MTTGIQGVARTKNGPRAVVPVTDLIRACFGQVTAAWVVDGEVRFEIENTLEARHLIGLFWGDDTPSVTYIKGGRDLRYRWTLPANRWARVYRAWLATQPD